MSAQEAHKRGPKFRVDRPVKVHIYLPTSLWTELNLFLYSPAEGCVPKGAYSKFFSDRTGEFLEKARQLRPQAGQQANPQASSQGSKHLGETQ